MKLATLCYIKHDGKTLMLHRVKKENDMHQDKWNGLGGKMEAGETLWPGGLKVKRGQ